MGIGNVTEIPSQKEIAVRYVGGGDMNRVGGGFDWNRGWRNQRLREAENLVVQRD